jgi:hypothetical protein
MKRIVLGLVLTMFLAGAALQAVGMIWNVSEKTQLDYGEGIVLWQASHVFDLKTAFRPLEQYPHLVFHYTPLYHIAVRILTGVLRDPLLSGRVVSMTSALWLVGLFAWTVLRATAAYAPAGIRWFGALLTCALVLHVPAMQWVPLARVDMLGLALQFTGLSMLSVGRFRFRNQMAAFCLLLLGLYTKQSFVAIPAASVLLIGLIRPARAIWLACGLLAAGLSVFLVLVWVTNGVIIRHWILYNVNPFHLGHALVWEWKASTNLAALIAAGLAMFWLSFPGGRRNSLRSWRRAVSARLAGSPLRRTGLGFGLAAAFGFVTSWGIGKDGANINYCLEWQLALCPLTGVFIVLLLRGWAQRERGMAFLRPLLVVLLGVTALQLGVEAVFDCDDAVGWTRGAREKRLKARREQADLIKLISTFPGPVVSENIFVLLQAGKSIPFEPAIVKGTTDAGVFDEGALIKRTSDRFFDAFILTTSTYSHNFSPRMLEAIRQNYRPYAFGDGTYLVYVR